MTTTVLGPTGSGAGSTSQLEQLVLDGMALNDDLTWEMQALEMPPPAKRLAWITGADADGALLGAEERYENRIVRATLRVVRAASMDAALGALGALVKKLQDAPKRYPPGMPLVWTPASSTKSLTAYVLAGEIENLPIELEGDLAGWLLQTPVLVVRFDCRPFLYDTAEKSVAEVTGTKLVTVDVPGVGGDVPAEGRLVVTDNATQGRKLVAVGLEQRHYNPAAPPDLYLDEAEMTVLTPATTVADAGASSGNAIQLTSLGATWQGIAGASGLPHRGSYLVTARAKTTADPTVRLRLLWRVGSGAWNVNASVIVCPLPTNGFFATALGIVDVPDGAANLELRVEAWADEATGATGVLLDTLDLMPLEVYGEARGGVADLGTGLIAYDTFNRGPGNLTGSSPDIGSAWTVVTGSDADDFTFQSVFAAGDPPGGVQRTAVSDANASTGRLVSPGVANVAYTSLQARVTLDFDSYGVILDGTENRFGVFARLTDLSNLLRATLRIETIPNTGKWRLKLAVVKRLAGTDTSLGVVKLAEAPSPFDYRVRLDVDTAGNYKAWAWEVGAAMPADPTISGQDNALATGGTLASGRYGLFDAFANGASGFTRTYRGFRASADVAQDVWVIPSGGRVELSALGEAAYDSAGNPAGSFRYRGQRLLIPPAGDAGRTSRIAVKARRGDGSAEEKGISDSTKVHVYWTERYLVAPR